MSYHQVCSSCCNKLNLIFNDFITSRCHRKYCGVCGYSSADDLALLDKDKVINAVSNYKTKQNLPLF